MRAHYHLLLFALAGAALGASQRLELAHASGATCDVSFWGEFASLRKISGPGQVESQDYWRKRMVLEARYLGVAFFDVQFGDEGYYEFLVDPLPQP